jgi:hypothetical protein
MSSFTIVESGEILEVIGGKTLIVSSPGYDAYAVELSPVPRIVNYTDGTFYWSEGDDKVVLYYYPDNYRSEFSPKFHPYHVTTSKQTGDVILFGRNANNEWNFQFGEDVYTGRIITEATTEDTLVMEVDGGRVAVNIHTGTLIYRP